MFTFIWLGLILIMLLLSILVVYIIIGVLSFIFRLFEEFELYEIAAKTWCIMDRSLSINCLKRRVKNGRQKSFRGSR